MTKIRILNAEAMGTEDNLEDGQVVDVEEYSDRAYMYYIPSGGWYSLLKAWEGRDFEIVEEEPEMTTFKKMKMRINNPEHSKAVQEWLFEQGYSWYSGTHVKCLEQSFIFTGTFSATEMTISSCNHNFQSSAAEEVDVQMLDPHLSKALPRKPQQSTFDNMLKNLKHVQKAIEKADNKQSKRLKDRDRMMSKINEMLPEGFVVQVSGEGVVEEAKVEDITEGSIWECIKDSDKHWCQDVTVGVLYKITRIGGSKDFLGITDNKGHTPGINTPTHLPTHRPDEFLRCFKRIS